MGERELCKKRTLEIIIEVLLHLLLNSTWRMHRKEFYEVG